MTLHNILYKLPNGEDKSSASYSARASYKFCKRFFYLTRVKGFRKRDEGIALSLGQIAEAAIVHQIRFRTGGVEEFERLWIEAKTTPGFASRYYTKVEQDWDNVLRMGKEWLQIFAIRQDTYPFQRAEFQVPLVKKIFPGSSYDAIKNVAYLDILSRPPGDHPALVPVKGWVGTRPLIIDVKTASRELPTKLVGLDPQLIEYGWMFDGESPVDVGFLWLLKKSHGMKSGSRVTLLAAASPFAAGTELVCLDKEGLDVWVGTKDAFDAYDLACKGLKGKALNMVAAKFLAAGQAVLVPQTAVSKQMVQFATARLNLQAIIDMGKVVGQETVEMVVSHETGFYPMEPGLRFPSDKCSTCDMRFVCSGDDEGRNKYLLRNGKEFEDSTEEK